MNRTPILFANVLVIATCGLVYELLAGTLASYLLGDSVTQFSLIIGIYLSAMGVGSWLSRYVDKGLARCFIEVELGVALLGGCSAPLLYFCFGQLLNLPGWFYLVLYGLVFAIGVLVGLELPLLMRIVKDHLDFKELVGRVLAFDYIGALAASLLFPILLVPWLGLVRTSLLFGVLNAAVGLWGTWLLQPLLERGVVGLRARAVLVIALLVIGFIRAETLTEYGEETALGEPIIYARSTPYQRIVITGNKNRFQLLLNGHQQFNSVDEYRYHEALVHPAMILNDTGPARQALRLGGAVGATCASPLDALPWLYLSPQPRNVLILGGGDGLALREVLKYDAASVGAVTLVDIDPEMTRLSERFERLAELNRQAFKDPRVNVVNQDAMIWIEKPGDAFDVVIIDFPDPSSFALGKLYTTRFYRLLRKRLAPDATIGIQCSSPLYANRAFWCIVRTLEASGLAVRPYHAPVPSFNGVWGFSLARAQPFDVPTWSPTAIERRYLNDQTMATMFVLPKDLEPVGEVTINRLDNQALVRYHESEWRRWAN